MPPPPPPRSIYRQDLHLCWQAPSCGSFSRWTWSQGCSCSVCTQLQEGLQASVFQFTPEKNPSLVMLDCFNNVWHESSWGSINWMDGTGGGLKINVWLSSGHLWSSMEMILWLELWSSTSRPSVFLWKVFIKKKKKKEASCWDLCGCAVFHCCFYYLSKTCFGLIWTNNSRMAETVYIW